MVRLTSNSALSDTPLRRGHSDHFAHIFNGALFRKPTLHARYRSRSRKALFQASVLVLYEELIHIRDLRTHQGVLMAQGPGCLE